MILGREQGFRKVIRRLGTVVSCDTTLRAVRVDLESGVMIKRQ